MQFEITQWKENEKLIIRMVSGASYNSYIQEFTLDPIPTGSRFTFAEEIVLPYGVFGKLIGLIAERMSAASVDKMLQKLKLLAEAA